MILVAVLLPTSAAVGGVFTVWGLGVRWPSASSFPPASSGGSLFGQCCLICRIFGHDLRELRVAGVLGGFYCPRCNSSERLPYPGPPSPPKDGA